MIKDLGTNTNGERTIEMTITIKIQHDDSVGTEQEMIDAFTLIDNAISENEALHEYIADYLMKDIPNIYELLCDISEVMSE